MAMGDVANFAVICRGRRPRRPEKRKPFLQRKMAIKQRIFHRHDNTKNTFRYTGRRGRRPLQNKFLSSPTNPNFAVEFLYHIVEKKRKKAAVRLTEWAVCGIITVSARNADMEAEASEL